MSRTLPQGRFGGATFARQATMALGLALTISAEAQVEALDTPSALAPLEVTAGTPAPGDPLMQATDIDVLTSVEKQRREATSLGETLDHINGVQNLSAGNQTGKPVIRGLSGERVQILSNGISVDHQQYGTRHMPNVDPFLSGRIEVVRGASSLLYGSGALGGSVDVQPLALDFTEDGTPRFGGQTLAGYSSNNEQKNLGWKAHHFGSSWSLNAGIIDRSAGRITTPKGEDAFNPDTPSPFQSPAPSDAPAYTDALDFTDFDQTNGQLGLGHRGAFGELRLRYTGWRNEHNFLLPPPAGNLQPGQGPEGVGQNLENDQLQLSGAFPAGGTWQFKPTLSWQNNLRQSNGTGTPRSGLFDGTLELEFDQYTARLVGQHQALGWFDAGRIGIEAKRKEQVSRGTTALGPTGEVENLALFAFEERSFGDFRLQTGLRHDWHETVADAGETRGPLNFTGRDQNDYSATSGSLGAVYSVTESLSLVGNLAGGFRAPSLFELYANGVHAGVAALQQGNPNLDEELSLNADLGLRWRTDALSGKITTYRNQIDDYIFLRDSGDTAGNGLPIFNNRQTDATLWGVDFEVRGRVTDAVELAATYSVVDSENDATGEDLTLQPADEITGEATWYLPGSGVVQSPYLRLGVRHNASKDAAPGEPFQQFDGAPFGTASTDAYTLTDLSAGFGLGTVQGRRVDLNFKVRNLTDESYRDFLDTYKGYARSPGRDIQVTMRIPWP